ncbi:MAG: FKBP-type peptidyl-prolyl cis-trans isomerase, partial [Candidatus Altarchaeaceae archaeon]
FGCVANGKLHIGEFLSIDEMKAFAEECKNASKELENESKELEVNKGMLVEVEYIGKLKNGTIFDNGTISFIVGSGEIIKGFEEGIIGMKVNESKSFVVPPEKGFGTLENLDSFPRFVVVSMETFKNVFNEEPEINKFYYNSNTLWKLKVVKINYDRSKCPEVKDIFDVVEMLEYLNGRIELSRYKNYDLIDDSEINIYDIFELMRRILES